MRLFEVIVTRTGLSLGLIGEPDYDIRSYNPFTANPSNAGSSQSGDNRAADPGVINFNNRTRGRGNQGFGEKEDFPSQPVFQDSNTMSDMDDSFGLMMGMNAENWLQDLFGSSFVDLDEIRRE